ncbi:hypothetical protein MPDQ_004162 [Monascus purpureus]|uniref:Uncharacterized protein n=1 Tax=Monascus purpureus TaxID=5098 RepID=A0A507QLS4_MONPU|nr:hypothetical protein MPDQ_004162 [Monascus purpureus]
MLKNRLRRLCTTCRTVPLAYHFSLSRPNDASLDLNKENVSFTASAFARTPCSCEEAVWLCYKCGQTLRSNDTTYRRVWTWRTRYSTYLDGNLGTGIGEGCQGVKCGRGEYCLAAQEIELEVDPEADDGFLTDAIHHHITTNNNNSNNYPLGHAGAAANSGAPLLVDLRDEEEPGYFRQEMVGVGGVVKHKAKKRVMVGACVIEYEDERDTGQYLVREEEGLHRSWCAWCWRVVPARQESDRT